LGKRRKRAGKDGWIYIRMTGSYKRRDAFSQGIRITIKRSFTIQLSAFVQRVSPESLGPSRSPRHDPSSTRRQLPSLPVHRIHALYFLREVVIRWKQRFQEEHSIIMTRTGEKMTRWCATSLGSMIPCADMFVAEHFAFKPGE
jgi:hypothetical protein